jgi:serine/threonine protein kinase
VGVTVSDLLRSVDPTAKILPAVRPSGTEGVAVHRVRTDRGDEGLRVVLRDYGTEDARWRRELRLLLARFVERALPDLRGHYGVRLPDGAERVMTLEQGGIRSYTEVLAHARARRPRPPVLAPALLVYAAYPLAVALQVIHRQGYCYRALGPETVELDVHGFRVLVAAPIAPPADEAGPAGDRVTRLYGGPSTAGVTEWSAPEVLAGGPAGAGTASDVYALGVALLAGLLGENPLGRDRTAAVVSEALGQARLHVRNFPCGEGLIRLMEGMLRVRPEDRLTAVDVVQALLDLREEASEEVGDLRIQFVLKALLDGAFDDVLGARQQEAWALLYRETQAPRRASSSGAEGVRRVEVTVSAGEGLAERLRVALEVLLRGRLDLEVEIPSGGGV